MERDTDPVVWACLFLAVLMAAMYWIATPSPAQTPPQPPCGPTKAMMAMLKARFGETPIVAGIGDNNTPLLIFSNPKTGTFTITIRRPGGVTCLLTSGTSWTPVEQEKEGTNL